MVNALIAGSLLHLTTLPKTQLNINWNAQKAGEEVKLYVFIIYFMYGAF